MAITVKYNFEGFKSLGVLDGATSHGMGIICNMVTNSKCKNTNTNTNTNSNAHNKYDLIKKKSRRCSPSLCNQGAYRVYATDLLHTGDSSKYKYKYKRNIIAYKCTCAFTNGKCNWEWNLLEEQVYPKEKM